MDNTKNCRDRFNKFRMLHRNMIKCIKFLLVIVVFILLISLIKFILCDQTITQEIKDIGSNSEIIVLIAAALGAIIGGIITYMINIRSLYISAHMKAQINNKTVIYEPLLMDFKRAHKELKNTDTYIFFVREEKNKPCIAILFDTWFKIKNDSRFYQVPDFFRKECIQVENDLNVYEDYGTKIENAAFDVFKEVLKKHKYDVTADEDRRTRVFFPKHYIFNKNFLNDLGIFNITNVLDEDKKMIQNEYLERLKVSNTIVQYHTSRSNLIKSLESVIKSTETIIMRIADVYEKRNNLL